MTFEKKEFEEKGFVVLENVLSNDEVNIVKKIYDNENRLKKDKKSVGNELEPSISENNEHTLRKVGKPFDRFQEFRHIFSSNKLINPIKAIIGPEVYLHSSKLICKPPKTGRKKPWHQDLAYWDDMDANQVTLWCAIDKATKENGCIQVIPGSHKHGLIQHEQIEDWQVRDSKIEQRQAVYLEMSPGSVLLLHVLTLHTTDMNRSDKRRLAAIVNYNGYPLKADQKSRYGSVEPISN